MPLPPSAARWSGLISTPEGVYRLQFNELGGEPLKIQFFANAPEDRYIQAARAVRDAQTFLWFSRFPLFQSFERDGRQVVRISDLRFYNGPAPSMMGASPQAPSTNFSYEVVFTPTGSVVSQGLKSE